MDSWSSHCWRSSTWGRRRRPPRTRQTPSEPPWGKRGDGRVTFRRLREGLTKLKPPRACTACARGPREVER
eukprot:5350352-Pyramimonas_sp.AAC.1